MQKIFYAIFILTLLLPALVYALPPPPATPGGPDNSDIDRILIFDTPVEDETVIQNQRFTINLSYIGESQPDHVTLLENDEVLETWQSSPYSLDIQREEVGVYEYSAIANINGEEITSVASRTITVEPLPPGLEDTSTTQDTEESEVECQPTYICSEWSTCEAGVQRRNCEDINDCREDREVTRECNVANTITINNVEYELVSRENGYFADVTLNHTTYNVTLRQEASTVFELLTANNQLYDAEKIRQNEYVLTRLTQYQTPQSQEDSNTLFVLFTTISILLSLTIIGFLLTRQGTVNKVIKESQVTTYLKYYVRNTKDKLQGILTPSNPEKNKAAFSNIAENAKKQERDIKALRKFLKQKSGSMRKKKEALVKVGWDEQRVEKEIARLLKEQSL